METEKPVPFMPVATPAPQAKERDFGIDCFRFVSLLTIFVFHIYRFPIDDVFLSNFLSFCVGIVAVGSTLGRKASGKKYSYWEYMWRRVKLIVFPPYIFFISIWLLTLVCPFPIVMRRFYSNHLVLNGYIWVIKGYFLMYALSPVFDKLDRRTSSHLRYYLYILLISSILEIVSLLLMVSFQPWPMLKTFYQYQIGVYLQFPMVHGFFLRVLSLNYSQYWTLFCSLMVYLTVFCVGFLTLGLNPHPEEYKTRLCNYCYAYALAASMISYRLIPLYERIFTTLKLESMVSFVSAHSLWIYLYQILFLAIEPTALPFFLRFSLLVSYIYCATYFQCSVVQYVSTFLPPAVATNFRLIMG